MRRVALRRYAVAHTSIQLSAEDRQYSYSTNPNSRLLLGSPVQSLGQYKSSVPFSHLVTGCLTRPVLISRIIDPTPFLPPAAASFSAPPSIDIGLYYKLDMMLLSRASTSLLQTYNVPDCRP